MLVGSSLNPTCELTVVDAATPNHIVFFQHIQTNGSWTDTGAMDGTPYVVELQSSTDSPPPEDDQVEKRLPWCLASLCRYSTCTT